MPRLRVTSSLEADFQSDWRNTDKCLLMFWFKFECFVPVLFLTWRISRSSLLMLFSVLKLTFHKLKDMLMHFSLSL